MSLGGLFVTVCDTPGVQEVVGAPLDHVALPVKRMIHTNAHFAGLSRRELRSIMFFRT